MDPQTDPTQQTNTGLSEEAIVTKISEAINKEYTSDNYLYDSFISLQLSPKDFLDIIQIAQVHYPHITDTAINKLYDQNYFFKKSINYFITQASQNLEKITANNITTIANPKNDQPTLELNKPLLPIKTYVMNQALRQIQYNYDIVLKGEHKNHIHTFAVCEVTDQAATSSFDERDKFNSQFLLWDLKTGKLGHTFDEPDPIHILAFNPNGSCIAGAMYKQNAIKVWGTKTKKLIHKLSCSHSIKSLSYSPTGSILNALRYYDDASLPTLITQWILTPTDNKAGEQINCFEVFSGNFYDSSFRGNIYTAKHPFLYLTTPETELRITKKNCGSLYLCMQAIKKTHNLKRELIESSAPYHQLTSLEKTKINNEISKKLAVSQQNNKQELQKK
jgi:hypothetical protein